MDSRKDTQDLVLKIGYKDWVKMPYESTWAVIFFNEIEFSLSRA